MHLRNLASAQIDHSEFLYNHSNFAGAVRLDASVNAEINDSVFTGNVAAASGGAIHSYGPEHLRITNCFFFENEAGGNGGALYMSLAGKTDVVNCVVAGNSAGGRGGAIRADDHHFSEVVNCTFHNNNADQGENAVSLSANHRLHTVTNCIIRNGGDEISISPGVAVTYCNIEGDYAGRGAHNFDADPLFVDAIGRDYRLRAGSACINAGDSQKAVEMIFWDMDHNYRVAGLLVDMGSYEFGAEPYAGLCENGVYPMVTGDINRDCRVDLNDLMIMAENWLLGVSIQFGM